MQRLMTESAQCISEFVAGASRHRQTATINRVANQCVPDMSEVHANLVRATRFKFYPYMRMRPVPADHAVMSDRLPTAFADRHFFSVGRVAVDRLIDRSASGEHPLADRLILATDFSLRQQVNKFLLYPGIARHQQQSTRTFIQPMNQTGPGQCRELVIEIKQSIDESSLRVAGTRMNDETHRFVDHQQVIVLVNDVERNILRMIADPRRQRFTHEHALTAQHFLFRTSRLAIKQYIARFNPLLDAAA